MPKDFPAEEVDQAILDAMLATYHDSDIVGRAVRTAARQQREQRAVHEAELMTIDAELFKTDASIERYLIAFVSGALSQEQCGERLQVLGMRAGELRRHHIELVDAMEDLSDHAPTEADLAAFGAGSPVS